MGAASSAVRRFVARNPIRAIRQRVRHACQVTVANVQRLPTQIRTILFEHRFNVLAVCCSVGTVALVVCLAELSPFLGIASIVASNICLLLFYLDIHRVETPQSRPIPIAVCYLKDPVSVTNNLPQHPWWYKFLYW